jgi:hypothetical protein
VTELEDALRIDIRAEVQRRVTHLEADLTTILAHWIRRPLNEEDIVAIDIDRPAAECSFAAVVDELTPLLETDRSL